MHAMAMALGLMMTMGFGSVARAGGPGLALIDTQPAPRTLHAFPRAEIVLHFDRPVDPASVDRLSFWAFGRWSGSCEGQYEFRDGDTTVALVPDRPLSAGEQVMVVLSHDVQANDGTTIRPDGYSWQFWVRTEPSPMIFPAGEVLSTNFGPESSRPYGGIGSDLDGDGWLDITVVNEDTSDLRVFLNRADGSGGFDPFLRPTFPVNVQASPSEPSDFNRDGVVDICVANIATDSVSILLGNGDGTFAPQQEVAVGDQPRGIVVLDADGDGDIDIVNTNYFTGNLSLLRNDGTGVFGAATFFDSGGDGERALAAGDLNEDLRLDLVVGAYDSQQIHVLVDAGDGVYSPASSQASGGDVWMLVLGDVNDDGHEDVAAVNVAPQPTGAILMGDGAGQLAAPTTHVVDPFPLATDLADLDGDGDLDWITSSFGGDWFFLTNNGTGQFAFSGEILAPAAASCALAFDTDNDGDLDLALIDEIADTISIVINSGTARAGDAEGDGVVGIQDFLRVLLEWGPCPDALPFEPCAADANGDGVVGIADFLIVLANWG